MFDVGGGTTDESGDALAGLLAVVRQVRLRPRPLEPAAIRADLGRLRQVINLLELEFALVAAAFAETEPEEWGGHVSPIQAMRHDYGMTGHAAATAVCVGSVAPSIPDSVAALEDGRLGFAHLGVLASTARALQDSPEGAVDEQPLLEQALAHGLKRFRDDCAHIRHAHDAAAYLAEQQGTPRTASSSSRAVSEARCSSRGPSIPRRRQRFGLPWIRWRAGPVPAICAVATSAMAMRSASCVCIPWTRVACPWSVASGPTSM